MCWLFGSSSVALIENSIFNTYYVPVNLVVLFIGGVFIFNVLKVEFYEVLFHSRFGNILLACSFSFL